MRNRRRNNYHRHQHDNNVILLTEFKFYNKTKKVINKSIIENIEKRIKEEKTIFWTNKVFAKNSIGFKFTCHDKNIHVRILDFESLKLNLEDFNKCKEIYGNKLFLTYKLTNEQDSILDDISFSNFELKGKIRLQNNWEETVDYLIKEKLLDKLSYTYRFSDYKKNLKLIFGNEITITEQEYDTIPNNSWSDEDVYHILKVIERRINNINYRVASVAHIRGSNSVEFDLRVISEKDNDYTRIDENTIYFKINNRYYYIDTSLNDYKGKKLIINHPLFYQMAKNIEEILTQEQNLITANIYNFYNDRVLAHYDGKLYLDNRQIKINEQYKKLLREDKEINIGSIRISTKKLEVAGERFKLKFDKKFLDIIDKFDDIREAFRHEDARYNFNVLYEKILQISALHIIRMSYTQDKEYKDFEHTEFKVNNIKVTVTKENNRIKINGIFCRIDDIYHILSRAICYNTTDDFNKHVKDVSYIGVDWKKMISNGLVLELYNPLYKIFNKIGRKIPEKTFMRFSLLWDKEKRSNVYLLLNGQKYLIKYKGKFKRSFNYPHRSIHMDTLKKQLDECIDGLTDDLVVEIVENAIEEAKIIQERGEELVKNTVNDIQAKQVEIEIKGSKIKGYTFNGRMSDVKYFINLSNLDVYKLEKDGSWNRRCIIDDSSKNRIFEDRLANRLVNIYNEPEKLKSFL